MTFREKLMKQHPKLVSDKYVGGCDGCPYDFGYEEKETSPCLTSGKTVCGEDGCTACWDREMPETMQEYIRYVHAILGERTKLEALAEECAELTQAALKLIRAKLDNENLTPVSEDEAIANLTEEAADVCGCLYLLGIFPAPFEHPIYYRKFKRWAERLGYEDESEDDNG